MSDDTDTIYTCKICGEEGRRLQWAKEHARTHRLRGDDMLKEDAETAATRRRFALVELE